jgi:hypothetical protein
MLYDHHQGSSNKPTGYIVADRPIESFKPFLKNMIGHVVVPAFIAVEQKSHQEFEHRDRRFAVQVERQTVEWLT